MFEKSFLTESRLRAFTLAEVLIVIGIIGIIAEITIPGLVQDYQKTVYVTSLKKSFSVFNEALQQLTLDEECLNDLRSANLFLYNDYTSFGNKIVKYLKISKNCGISTTEKCGANAIKSNIDGSGSNNAFDLTSNDYRFITADGMSYAIHPIFFGAFSSNCFLSSPDGSIHLCAELTVDINGAKGPNYMGRDVFNFYITSEKGLYPEGGALLDSSGWWNYNNQNYCSNDSATTKDGWFCSGRIIEKGWQMDY